MSHLHTIAECLAPVAIIDTGGAPVAVVSFGDYPATVNIDSADPGWLRQCAAAFTVAADQLEVAQANARVKAS